MSLPLLIILLSLSAILLFIESTGVRTTLSMGSTFRGDVKRETLFLQQWGQSVCTPIAALLIWQIDRPHAKNALAVIIGVCCASFSCFILKRLLGRVRPDREHAGKFLGPSLKHANWRESFPSSHSACTIAFSVYLAHLYPAAAITFWTLGIITAALRYVMNAHYPSDILAGIAIGYVCAFVALKIVPI